MRIASVKIHNYNNSYRQNSRKVIGFSGGFDKMSNATQEKLCNFLASENLKSVKMTYIEAKKILEGLGCTITRNTGSHASVHKEGCKTSCSIVDPHKQSSKNLPIEDLCKLRKFITDVIKKVD